MLRYIFAAMAQLSVAGSAAASAGVVYPPWPADARDDTDSRVMAYYQTRCSEWGRENGHAGDQLSQYMAFCMKQMPVLRPVGLED